MPITEVTEQFLTKLAASLADNTFVRVALSGANDPTGPGKVLGRIIDIKGEPHVSFTLRYPTKDVTKNFTVRESMTWVRSQLRGAFRNALLNTTTKDWQLAQPLKGAPRLVAHKAAAAEAPARTHDQSRETFLNETAHDWLHGLGITDTNGKVRAAMADKHRQIHHYLEILSHLAQDCGWSGTSDKELVLADMGCGKGYLTFGAWHLFRRMWQQPVRVIGVETRLELVATTFQLAHRIKAEGLEFIAGNIQSAQLPRVDALIALHACDTATDDAIKRGIELGAKLIVVAPCCQHEVRPQLGKPEPLAAVLRHGVMAERMSEWVTDGLRALYLEWAGYRTKAFEFVASEHTPKNLMIAAVKEREPFTDLAAKQRIEELKAFFGIKQQALDSLLEKAASS